MTLRAVTIDFETASAVDLKKAGGWRYAEDPTTEILCLCWKSLGGDGGSWRPGDDLSPLQELSSNADITFIAHNAAFEKAIWRKIMVAEYGLPDIPNSRWHCTMAACAMRGVALDLDKAAVMLQLPVQKDMVGSKFTKGLSKPKKDGTYDRTATAYERVLSYCQQDVLAEDALHSRVGWLPVGERKVWLLDQRINERGVRLDLEFIRAASKIVFEASTPLIKEFSELTGGLGPTQVEKFGDWLRANGCNLPNLAKKTIAAALGGSIDGEDDAEEIGTFGDTATLSLSSSVSRALYIRQLVGSASVKKLARMEAVVCEDGRARGLLQYHGAGPGRWAGRLLQPQNFPRPTLREDNEPTPYETVVDAIMSGDHEYVDLLLGPPVEAVVSGLRHALVPAPDREYAVGDFATIELRINLGLAGQHDILERLRTDPKYDPYCDNASLIYKHPVDKKKHPEKRQTGKNSVLGLGFQMGPPKFQYKYAPKEDLEFCKEVVRTFREDWAPNIKYNWWDLEKAALETMKTGRPHEERGIQYRLEDGWMTARLPSGRKLWYFNPKLIRKAMPWDHTDVRLAWTYQAVKNKKVETIDAYGGHLTENVVQAMARDLMVTAMFKCEENNLPVVLTVHDEIVTEPLTKDADAKALQQIMEDTPPWALSMGIPVKAECWQGDRYRK